MTGLIDFTEERGTSWDDTDAFNGDEFMVNRGIYPQRILLVVTGCYQDVKRRSFETNVTPRTMDSLGRIIEDSSVVGNLDLIGLAKASNEMIKPSTYIDKEVNIVNGWDEPRCRFFGEFVRPLGSGSMQTYTYTGFTDYVGVDQDGNIDPEMPIHITSVTITSHSDTGGGRRSSRITSDANVMVASINYEGDDYDTIRRRRSHRDDAELLLDPATVMTTKQARDSFMDMSTSGVPMSPAHAQIGKTAKMMNRAYNIPSHYLSKTLSISRNTMDDPLYDTSIHDRSAQQAQIISGLKSPYVTDDPLFSLYRDHGMCYRATLTWGDLTEFFGGLNDDKITKVIFPGSMRQSRSRDMMGALRDVGMETRESSDTWDNSHIETVIATSVTQQLPSLMMSELIESIRFTVTNDSMYVGSLDEAYQWTFGDSRRSSDDNRSSVIYLTRMPPRYEMQRLEAFKLKFEKLIMDVVTHDSTLRCTMMVDCSVQGDCTVRVQLEDGAEHQHTLPTFADNISSPIITTDRDRYDTFAGDIINIVDDVTSNDY